MQHQPPRPLLFVGQISVEGQVGVDQHATTAEHTGACEHGPSGGRIVPRDERHRLSLAGGECQIAASSDDGGGSSSGVTG